MKGVNICELMIDRAIDRLGTRNIEGLMHQRVSHVSAIWVILIISGIGKQCGSFD